MQAVGAGYDQTRRHQARPELRRPSGSHQVGDGGGVCAAGNLLKVADPSSSGKKIGGPGTLQRRYLATLAL
jgi:hypothetical protein